MKKSYLLLFVGIFTLCLYSSASAAATSVGGALVEIGDGINARWVNVSYAPHSVASALEALGLDSNDSRYQGEINQVVSAIDVADSAIHGHVTGYTSDPLTPDNSYAVEYTGYINITSSDTYSFNAYTDDGFRLVIGGEIIAEYDGDRSASSTYADAYLEAGLYTFSLIGWEQGGVFVNELSWHDSSTSAWSLVDSTVLFTSNPVPVPSAILLLGFGLLGLAGTNRKKQR